MRFGGNIFLVRCSDEPFEGLPLKRDRLELSWGENRIDYETDNVVERGVVRGINTQ